MNLHLEGHDYEQDLLLIAKLFFYEHEDISITSILSYTDTCICAKTVAVKDMKPAVDESTIPLTDENRKKKFTLALLARSLVKALRQFKDVKLPWGIMTGIRPAKHARVYIEQGKTDNEIYELLRTIYNVSDEKIALALSVAKNELTVTSNVKPDSCSLYVGIPFCPTRCQYCSFVSMDITKSGRYIDDYITLLTKEIEYAAELLQKHGMRVEHIYVGGGTPTAVSEEHLDRYLSALNKCFDISTITEFSVEAGRPDTITGKKLEIIKKSGVNRLSINPQSMNDKTLKLIGRDHSAIEIRDKFKLARQMGFNNINTDIIAGLPKETLADFSCTLDQMIDLSPENITVHTMSVKRGSRLAQELELTRLTHADTVEQMIDLSQKMLTQSGYTPYYMYRQKNMLGSLENVGWSKSGHMSLYNVNIMEEVQTIMALGCSGASKAVIYGPDNNVRIERVFNFKDPVEYIRRFDEILQKKDIIMQLLKEPY